MGSRILGLDGQRRRKAELRAYQQAGVPEKALERVQVLELRQLLKMMSEEAPDAVNPWRATRFVASPSAAKLAQELAP